MQPYWVEEKEEAQEESGTVLPVASRTGLPTTFVVVQATSVARLLDLVPVLVQPRRRNGRLGAVLAVQESVASAISALALAWHSCCKCLPIAQMVAKVAARVRVNSAKTAQLGNVPTAASQISLATTSAEVLGERWAARLPSQKTGSVTVASGTSRATRFVVAPGRWDASLLNQMLRTELIARLFLPPARTFCNASDLINI